MASSSKKNSSKGFNLTGLSLLAVPLLLIPLISAFAGWVHGSFFNYMVVFLIPFTVWFFWRWYNSRIALYTLVFFGLCIYIVNTLVVGGGLSFSLIFIPISVVGFRLFLEWFNSTY